MNYTYSDLWLCLACGIFIWLYLVMHVKSVFIGSFAMLNVFMSIPLSIDLYYYLFGIEYFALLHNLVIIIVMGVGADDIFVFNDMWKQAKQINILKADTNRRMAYAFRRSAKAMMVTSLTTMVSFMATAVTYIIPVSTFGIFASIIIPVNYFLVISVLPAYYMIYENHLKERCKWIPYRCQCLRKYGRRLGDGPVDDE
jgi:predicted RND superfamily exporter protein